MQKYRFIMSRLAVVALAAAVVAFASVANAKNSDDVAKEFADLNENDGAVGQDWFDLAAKARAADELSIASKSLQHAENLEFSPVRIGMEKTRILVADGKPAEAVSELQALLDSGFTSVNFVIGDSLINSMEGRPDYDAVIEKMSVQAYPCDHQQAFKDFDFWIGKWDVHATSGALVGSNIIERAERGCVLIENWTNSSGGTGMSVNYLDKASDEWVQIWNAEGGSQINIRGGMTDDGMLLEGYIHYIGNGTTAPFRGLWTPMPDGRVRQYFEESNDDRKTWVPWFEAFYSKAE